MTYCQLTATDDDELLLARLLERDNRSLGSLKQTLMATPLLRMTPAQKTLKAIRMCFDLLADSCSLSQMTMNYCSLGCLKQTLMATPLLRMTLAQQETEGNTRCPLTYCQTRAARLELNAPDDDELLVPRLLETDTDCDTTAENDTTTGESEGKYGCALTYSHSGDLLLDSRSMTRMTTNYCSLGCLKKTLIATALLRMTPPQKTLKAIRMCFDLLADSTSLSQMIMNYC